MTYQEALITQIELYFHDIIEPYHDVTVEGMKKAKKLSLFKKQDFTVYIDAFEKFRDKAMRLESMDIPIPDHDVETKLLAKDFRNSLISFMALCEANMVFYDWNQRKQYKDSGITVKGYSEVMSNMQAALKEAVIDLDFLERTYKKYSGDQPFEE